MALNTVIVYKMTTVLMTGMSHNIVKGGCSNGRTRRRILCDEGFSFLISVVVIMTTATQQHIIWRQVKIQVDWRRLRPILVPQIGIKCRSVYFISALLVVNLLMSPSHCRLQSGLSVHYLWASSVLELRFLLTSQL